MEALQLKRPGRAQRDQIFSFLEGLADDPGQAGDFTERDAAGNSVHIKIIGDYALTYWADHAVKEVKVTKIEKAEWI